MSQRYSSLLRQWRLFSFEWKQTRGSVSTSRRIVGNLSIICLSIYPTWSFNLKNWGVRISPHPETTLRIGTQQEIGTHIYRRTFFLLARHDQKRARRWESRQTKPKASQETLEEPVLEFSEWRRRGSINEEKKHHSAKLGLKLPTTPLTEQTNVWVLYRALPKLTGPICWVKR